MEEYRKQLEECEKLWSKHGCDCLSFEMDWLKKQINQLSTKQTTAVADEK